MKKNKTVIDSFGKEKSKNWFTLFSIFFLIAGFGIFLSGCSDRILKEQRIENRAKGKVYKGFQINRKGAIRAVSELMPIDTTSKVTIKIERTVDTFSKVDTFYTPAEGDSCQNLVFNNYHHTKEIITKDSIITIPDRAEIILMKSSKDSLAAEYNILDKKHTGLKTKYDISIKAVVIMGTIIFVSIILLIIYLYIKYKAKSFKII